ncbi:TlpA family protein disulfide reductase [Carboxylicivirga mesophila]|uniref:TlpA family protein disulfide reductase n=1 Tax=Carboxylicivirga mesophila TaxID=1166478 RepID=A0ABS5K4V6_9BACT|nr:thioredoxin-like domain-containing protein [Carboxylicivirga mesophila]MBS2210043.1 TlpA family protein disulfide reductase [Carboxylicivirga mesophila]
MRYFVLAAMALLFLNCSKPQKTPYLTIKPEQDLNGKVELYRIDETTQLFDRAIQAEEGHWEFVTDSVPEGIYSLHINGEKVASLIINSTFPATITGHFQVNDQRLSVSGNSETKALWKCEQLAREAAYEIEQLVAGRPDSIVAEEFVHVRDSFYTNINAIIDKKAKEINRIANNHRNTLLPLLAMQLKAGNHYLFHPEQYADLYYETSNQLQNRYPDYWPVRQFATHVDSLMNRSLFNAITKEGRTFPAISVPDAWKQEVRLDSLISQPTLFVIWKSDDAASRHITGQLMRWTRPYRNQGLKVCMISMDDDRDKWLSAIKEDRLAVLHLSDLNGDTSPVLQQLGLSAIPYLLLTDTNRIIVKRTRELDDLSTAMRQLMKN